MNTSNKQVAAPVQATNVVKSTKHEFRLTELPDVSVIAIHMNNLINTYGPELVKEVIIQLYLKKPIGRPDYSKKAVSE